MRNILLIMLSCCFGCGNIASADIISSNGSVYYGFCSDDWVTCISKTCPNGYDIIRESSTIDHAIIKCKP